MEKYFMQYAICGLKDGKWYREHPNKEFIQDFDKLYEKVKEIIKALINKIMPMFEWICKVIYPKIQKDIKYSAIYFRTKSRRIRKKQITLLRKELLRKLRHPSRNKNTKE